MKRCVSILLACIFLLTAFTGCSNSNATTGAGTSQPPVSATPGAQASASPQTSAAASETPVSTEPKIFRWSTATTLNTGNPYDGDTNIADYTSGKLYMLVPNDTKDSLAVVPSIADGEPVTEDGYTWTIKLLKDAKWANGEPLTVDDFMYSWQQAINPDVLYPNGSQLAQNFIKVENAMAYYRQATSDKEVLWEDVGLKKVDDYTITVTTTEKYTATDVKRHFTTRSTGLVYPEIYETTMNADGKSSTYGTELDLMLASGPYILDNWSKGTEYNFVKNPNWARADMIDLDGISLRIIPDELTQLQLFQKGDLDYLQIGANGYEEFGDDPRTYPYLSSAIYEVNINRGNPAKTWLNNANLAKAMYWGIDRSALEKINPNLEASPFFVPEPVIVYEDGTTFRSLDVAKANLPENGGYDPDKALEYFEAFLAEEKISKASMSVIYSETSQASRTTAEYMQSSLANLFGADRFEITLQAMTGSNAMALMRTSQGASVDTWDMCIYSWDLAAAILYPNRKFEVYTSTDTRRYTDYNSQELDELYAYSTTEACRLNEEEMAKTIAEMEKVFLDNMLTVPIFCVKQYYIHSDRAILPVVKRLPTLGFAWIFMDMK